MENVGTLIKSRLEQIVVENEMLRAGFAALPYLVMRDLRLSVGGRFCYAILLMYAWQEGSCFPGQGRMADDIGMSQRHLRRYLAELRDCGYISWQKTMPWGTNTYVLHDVKSKLVSKPKRTRASSSSGHRRPHRRDTGVRQIDPAVKTQPIRLRGLR